MQPVQMIDAKLDYGAVGDNTADDTTSLQNAINAGSSAQLPVSLSGGSYKITSPLVPGANTMLIGMSSAPGFGTLLRPSGCAAIDIGLGGPQVFACKFANFRIWPQGAAPDHILYVDNCYNVAFENVFIHQAQAGLTTATVVIDGTHGGSNAVIWNNFAIRNDSSPPARQLLMNKNCGSHTFYTPDIENAGTLMTWKGGRIDMFSPYTERAGVYALNVNPDASDANCRLNIFGGELGAAASGIAVAVQAGAKNLTTTGTSIRSYGNQYAIYVYGIPTGKLIFRGYKPNITMPGVDQIAAGLDQVSGVTGWNPWLSFPDFPMGL
jgi:hypothetical protein